MSIYLRTQSCKIRMSIYLGTQSCKIRMSIYLGTQSCKIRMSIYLGTQSCKIRMSIYLGTQSCQIRMSIYLGTQSHKSPVLSCFGVWILTSYRYHGGRRPSSDDSFYSATIIAPSALDKPSVMKRYHRRRTCSHTSPRRSPTMVTLHDIRFVECRWWKDGWTVKTVVT